MMKLHQLTYTALIAITLVGCTGTQTFTTAARPGDTVALAVGWNQAINKDNISVAFQSGTSTVTYSPGDSHIRAVTQLYPDPVSRLVVGYQTNQNLGLNENVLGYGIDVGHTAHDIDWNQTVVYVDLPSSLPTGMTDITLTGPAGNLTASPLSVAVLSGTGQPNTFNVQGSALTSATNFLGTLERRNYYTVNISGSTVPYAVQLALTHTPGAGVPWVSNPRGDIKNLAWQDDGTTISVMITPSHGVPLENIKHFKFYVAGGVTGLNVASITAYDITGYPITGINADVSYTP